MLSARNIAALGFMTFAMYLGAGNLIFPLFWAIRPVDICLKVWLDFCWRVSAYPLLL